MDKQVDLAALNGAAGRAGLEVRYGGELVGFAEALVRGDASALAQARLKLMSAAGAAVLVDAAAVAANFQRMVRIADATGIPADNIDTDLSREVRSTLGLGSLASAGNTPGARD